ncbi:MAG: hypothetical protein WC655_21945 [Candidatus Hydrogenedentales bacterium]
MSQSLEAPAHPKKSDAFSIVQIHDLAGAYRIARLRYEVYVSERNQEVDGVCHRRKVIVDPFDVHPATTLFGAIDPKGDLIGTIRISVLTPDELPYDLANLLHVQKWESMQISMAAYVSRCVVVDKWRGGEVSRELFASGYASVLQSGADFIVCVASEGLAPHYERLGFVKYAETVSASDGHIRHALVLPSKAVSYLKRKGSLFGKVAVDLGVPDSPPELHDVFWRQFGLEYSSTMGAIA